jgi:ankyrin repeat protein
MIRRRAWEFGATAAFILLAGVVVAGFFAWRERQRRLDRELVRVLSSDGFSQAKCNRLLSLLRQGANASAQSNLTGWTVLTDAAAVNHLPLLQEALARGADVDGDAAVPCLLEGTPLMMAAESGSLESAQMLLAHGADINRRTSTGATALDYAKTYHHPALIRLLKQHGAQE